MLAVQVLSESISILTESIINSIQKDLGEFRPQPFPMLTLEIKLYALKI
jgi:hypothetical protein